MFSFFKSKKEIKYTLKEYLSESDDKKKSSNIEIQQSDLFYIYELFMNERIEEIKKLNKLDFIMEDLFKIFVNLKEEDISNYLIEKQISVFFYRNIYYFFLIFFFKNFRINKVFDFLKNNYYEYLKNDYIFDISFDKWIETFAEIYSINPKKYTFYNYIVIILYNKKYNIKNNINNIFIIFNINIFNLEKYYMDYIVNIIKEYTELLVKEYIKFFKNEEFVYAQFVEFLNKLLKFYQLQEYINFYLNVVFNYYRYNNNLSYLIEGLKNNKLNYLTKTEFIEILKNTKIDKKLKNKYFLMLKIQKENENKKFLQQLEETIQNKQQQLKNLEDNTKYKCDINIKLTKAKLIQEIKKLKNKKRHFKIEKYILNNTDFYLLLLIRIDGKFLLKNMNNDIDTVLLQIYLETYFQNNLEKYKKLLYFINRFKNINKFKKLINLIFEKIELTKEDVKNLKNIFFYYPVLEKEILSKEIIEYNKKNFTFVDLQNLLYKGIDLIQQIYDFHLLEYFSQNNVDTLKKYLYFGYKKDIELIKKVLNEDDFDFDEIEKTSKILKDKVKKLNIPDEEKIKNMKEYFDRY